MMDCFHAISFRSLHCSNSATKFLMKLSGNRNQRAVVRTTCDDLSVIKQRSGFVAAKVRSPLMYCGNCRAKRHGGDRPRPHDPTARRPTPGLSEYVFPFDTVYACAKYLLLEDKYFERQIATYALLHQEDTYGTTDFLLMIW